jgi:hypothetical protein
MLFDRSQLMRYNPSIPNDSPSAGGKVASDWDGCGFLSESRLYCNRLVTCPSFLSSLSRVPAPGVWKKHTPMAKPAAPPRWLPLISSGVGA